MNYIPVIDIHLLIKSVPFILSGIGYTLGIGILSFIIGNIIGILLVCVRILDIKIFNWVIKFYCSFFRGIPALVLLFLIYFGLPYQLDAVLSSIICFTITCSAFIVEIYRGALKGVPRGQYDAGLATGMSLFGVLYYIIFPQTFKIAIPALSNVFIDVVKGTSLAATITVPEIFQKAKIIGGRTFDYFTMYILVAIIYWLLCMLIERVQTYLENYFTH